MKELFRKISAKASLAVGSPWGFIIALSLIFIWLATGRFFDYSNTWQLVINTFTTIVTFLMVFLIQNTQNRDARAIHLKLDELLKGIKGARDSFVDIEEVSDKELETLHKEFQTIHEKYASELEKRKKK